MKRFTSNERRETSRNAMIRGGALVAKGEVVKCVVLDVSVSGARVHLLGVAEAPRTAILHLPDGSTRAAHRCWQRNAEVGFVFSRGAESPEAPPVLAATPG